MAMAMCLLPLSASATNGYFSHGYSPQQKALAGAGTAWATDAFAGSINPALLTQVGHRIDFSISLFMPVRYFRVENKPDLEPVTGAGLMQINHFNRNGDPFGKVRSENDLFVVPAFAISWRIDENAVWGIALYGNGGMNTEYARGAVTFANGNAPQLAGFTETCEGAFGGGENIGSPGAFNLCGNGASTASVGLMQLFIVPTYAHEFGALSVGISPMFAVQRFVATGLQAFAKFSKYPEHVSDQGASFSYGAGVRVGFTYEVTSWLHFGASYQSRIYMTKFDEYRGLFANGGAFDIPATYNIGIAILPTPNQRILIDYQHINYNAVESVGAPLEPNEFVNQCARPRLGFGGPVNENACLGGTHGPGFGWQDVAVYKFGYELELGNFTYRLGFSNNNQPIRGNQVLFNILAPGTTEYHYTAGLSWQVTDSLGLDLAIMYAPPKEVTGKNPLSHVEGGVASLLFGGPNFGTDPDDQDITIGMYQYEVTLGFHIIYD